jgi:hypothetical protein
MDLEAARKTLAKPSAFSKKKIAFIGAAGLLLVAGIALRASHYFGETSAESEPTAIVAPTPDSAAPSPAEKTESIAKTPAAPVAPVTPDAAPAPSEPAVTQEPAPTPSDPAQQAGETAEQPAPEGQAERADLPGAGMILVSRKPVEVLAGPSASAPAMFGFPAGRPFRVIGREGSFVQIQDLRSSAQGWIDATALAAPPRAAPSAAAPTRTSPSAAAPSQSKPSAVRKPATAAADPKPKPAKKNAPAVADSEPATASDPAQARRPPTLFGRGGFFGGIFNN